MSSLFNNAASAAANGAWRDSGFAMTHLQPHAGKTLRVEIVPPLGVLPAPSFSLRVTGDGQWEPVATEAATATAPPDATLRLSPRTGLRLAQWPEKPGQSLDLAGEPDFVAALRDLHDVLPIAIEDRVSSIVGPIAAHALMTTLRSIARWPAQAAERFGAGTGAWMSEERRMLVDRASFERFSKDVEALAERTKHL